MVSPLGVPLDVDGHFRRARAVIREGGRSSTLPIMEFACAHCPRAIEVLAELTNNRKATATVCAMAVDRILDRGYGKPPQLNTTDAGQFRRAVAMTEHELAHIASGGQDADRSRLP